MLTISQGILIICISLLIGAIIGAYCLYELLYRKKVTVDDITDLLFEEENN